MKFIRHSNCTEKGSREDCIFLLWCGVVCFYLEYLCRILILLSGQGKQSWSFGTGGASLLAE